MFVAARAFGQGGSAACGETFTPPEHSRGLTQKTHLPSVQDS